MSVPQFKEGLEDVVVLRSAICYIDGQEGRLLYRGYNIDDIVEKCSFEEVVWLLWHGDLPNRAELEQFRQELTASVELPPAYFQFLASLPREAHAMALLRTAASALGHYDPEAEEPGVAANRRKAIRLVARVPVVVAALGRLAQGKEPIPPRHDLGIAANFLYMLQGRDPDPLHVHVMDTCLTLHADHELNASTFAARVTAATLSDLYSAIAAGIGALKGPLHGGANERVMRMLMEIGSPERVEAYVDRALAEKQKIPGFGHRVYRVRDPRAKHLGKFSRRLGELMGDLRWYEISQRLEEVMAARKGLYANVDFYSASTYHMMGIPISLFTPLFAMSRVAGWSAHVLEQYANNRLIRPRAEYAGPLIREFIPLSNR